MAANRSLFAAAAKEKVKTVVYKQCDCIAFVKSCFAAAGGSCKAAGTNDCWRNYMSKKGKTKDYQLQVGDVVFRWRQESAKLPAKYHGDGIGDIFHIAIITSLTDGIEICHSSNSTDNGRIDKFKSKEELAARYMYAGTLKDTAAAATSNDLSQVITLLEQALNLLKSLGKGS